MPALETIPFVAAAAGEALADMIERVKGGVVMVHSGRQGAGSGVVWRSDGIVITNHHVVARRDETAVVFSDDRQVAARVIAREPALDLAALRVELDSLRPVDIGQSENVRVGELVVAVGNPWGQRGVVTAGVVSAIGEVETPWRRGKAEYIRSDVRLAPGNSGGPMLDAHGKVIGINAMIFGGDLGVAIPSHIVSQFLSVAEGQRPVLGVGVQTVDLPPMYRAASQREHGLLVVELQAGGGAEQAGMYIGDVLLDVDGRPVHDAHSLTYTLARHSAGTSVALRYLRAGDIRTAEAQLGAVPAAQAA